MASRNVRIGLIQMSMTSDSDKNLKTALEGVDEAAKKGAQVVCLPELFAWRYFPSSRSAHQSPETIPGRISRALSQSARSNRVVLVGGSIFEMAGRSTFNTCLVFDQNGEMISKYRKVHVPQDEHYYEQDYFKPGHEYSVANTRFGRLGTLICFDQWYPEAARVDRLLGAKIIFYPTAIGWVRGIEPVEGDWKRAWELVQVGHAIANSVVICAVNRVGSDGPMTFWGGSFVCDQFGKILFRAGDRPGVFTVDCDLRLGDMIERGWSFMRNRKKRSYTAITR